MKDFILLFLYLTTLRSTNYITYRRFFTASFVSPNHWKKPASVAGTICLSCSGVETKEQCTHLETCRNDEICFIHKYVTESGAQQFDLGCTYPEVIQKRLNGVVDFYRSWDEYKQGFGDPAGEYWLGNDALHKISSSTGHQLSIYMEDFDANFVYANYSNFLIGDELENYQLTISGFSGSPGAGDSLNSGNHYSFSTKDRDNDPYYYLHCAQYEHGAWWYYNCGSSNLNGPYVAGFNGNETSAFWYAWKSSYFSLKKITMMIKRIRKID